MKKPNKSTMNSILERGRASLRTQVEDFFATPARITATVERVIEDHITEVVCAVLGFDRNVSRWELRGGWRERTPSYKAIETIAADFVAANADRLFKDAIAKVNPEMLYRQCLGDIKDHYEHAVSAHLRAKVEAWVKSQGFESAEAIFEDVLAKLGNTSVQVASEGDE